jgi:hypothetical protein
MNNAEVDAPIGDELLWGARAIATEIKRTPRQTIHLLETGKLPAKKVGRTWCAHKRVLRGYFATTSNVEVA